MYSVCGTVAVADATVVAFVIAAVVINVMIHDDERVLMMISIHKLPVVFIVASGKT